MPLPSTFDFSSQEAPPPTGRGNRQTKPTAKFNEYKNSLSKSRRSKNNNGQQDMVLGPVETADTSGVISQGSSTTLTSVGGAPWQTPSATSSPPNFGQNFQPQVSHCIPSLPYQRPSPGPGVVDPYGVGGFKTFGEVNYNPVLNLDEQSQEELWDNAPNDATVDPDQEARIQAADEHLIELPPMPSSMISSSRVTPNNRRAARQPTAKANTNPGFLSNLPGSEQLIKMSDSEDEVETDSKKRPTLRGLGDSHSMTLTTLASSYFSFMVIATVPFPEGAVVHEMVLRAWKAASAELNIEFLPPSPNEKALVVRYIAQARGKVKTIARDKLIQHDPFKSLNVINTVTDRGTGEERDETADERVARVRDTVTTLVNELAFLFENPLGPPRIDPVTGKYGQGSMFGHPLIQDILNELFFKRGKSIPLGIKHESLLSAGMTYSAVALISTAILCAIHEYATGTFAGVDFTDSEYAKEYQFIYARLLEWEETCKKGGTDGVQVFLLKLVRSGRAYFGVQEGGKMQKVSETSKRSFSSVFEQMESSKRPRLEGNSLEMP